MRKDLSFISALLLAMTILAACEKDKPDCYQPNAISLYTYFVSRNIYDSSRIDTINGTPTSIDSTIVTYPDTFFRAPAMISLHMSRNIQVTGNQQFAYLAVPLNPDTGSMQYALQYDTATASVSDTLTYYYHTSIHFISNSCGYTHFFNIDSMHATTHVLDSFAIITRAVTNKTSDRHVQLYFFHQ